MPGMVGHKAAWDAYLALSEQQRTNWTLLPSILSALLRELQDGHPEPSQEVRRRLIAHLLDSLSPSTTSPLSASLHPSSPAALLNPTLSLLKLLGRNAAGSEELARERGLSVLLSYGGLERAAVTLPPKRYPSSYRSKRRFQARGLGISEFRPDEDEASFVGRDDSYAVDDDPQTPMPPREEEPDPLSPSEAEALRCLCNVLMLHPTARDVFAVVVQENQEWIAGMVRLLPVKGAGFLAGRLAFLLTSKPGDHITELAESGELVDHLEDFATSCLNALRSPSPTIQASLTSGPAPTKMNILHEHLKLIYNLMLQYSRQPQVRRRESTTDSLLSPKSSAGDESESEAPADNSRPGSPQAPSTPSRPPSSKSKKKRFWSPQPNTATTTSLNATTATPPEPLTLSRSRSSQSSGRSKSPRALAQRIKSAVTGKPPPMPPLPSSVTSNMTTVPGDGAGEMTLEGANYFLPIFKPYLSLAVLLPLQRKSVVDDGKDPSSVVRAALNTLLNFPIQLEELDSAYECSWLQDVPYADVAYPSLAALPSRLLEILQLALDAWFPPDKLGRTIEGKPSRYLPSPPDELIPKGSGEAARAEEIFGPIMLLLRKITLLNEPAEGVKQLLLPKDIDRSVPLDRRTDLIGHLCRLLSSILLPNTAYGVGEFLYNLCERNPVKLSTELGYGLAAGFLQNRGELIPPPAPADDDDDEEQSSEERVRRPVNPITGAYEVPKPKGLKEMTDEEKEREAERLFVLFDRMHKTGVMDVENPVDKARQEGRMEISTEEQKEQARKLREQDEHDEKEAEDEMKRYKERKAAQAARASA